MMHAQREVVRSPPAVVAVDNGWQREREMLIMKVAQATQSAAACAHVAQAAQTDRHKDMETIKKLRGELRGFKLARAKVRDPTAWTITRHDGPNHLGF